jgi:hypothetical protein
MSPRLPIRCDADLALVHAGNVGAQDVLALSLDEINGDGPAGWV